MGEIKDGVIEETENKIGRVGMPGYTLQELVAKLGKKNLAKGVKVDIIEGTVDVDLSLELEYGNSIKTVSENVQIKVKQAIESMTGLVVGSVNVVVSGMRRRSRLVIP